MTSPRATAPALGAAPALHLPPQQRHWLSSGLEVIVVAQRDLPVVDVRFFARGGASAHGPASGGLERAKPRRGSPPGSIPHSKTTVRF